MLLVEETAVLAVAEVVLVAAEVLAVAEVALEPAEVVLAVAALEPEPVEVVLLAAGVVRDLESQALPQFPWACLLRPTLQHLESPFSVAELTEEALSNRLRFLRKQRLADRINTCSSLRSKHGARRSVSANDAGPAS
jgi:hypothetical protein